MKQILILTLISMYFLPSQIHGANLHIQTCERGFIGYEYNPKLDKQCSKLWAYWTRQIKSSFNHK